MRFRKLVLLVAVLAAVSICDPRSGAGSPVSRLRWRAESEQDGTLVLAWMRDNEFFDKAFAAVVAAATRARVPVIILTPGLEDQDHAVALLQSEAVLVDRLQFIDCPLDSIWIRDYGPISIRRNGGAAFLVDPNSYSSLEDWDQDRAVPQVLAQALSYPMLRPGAFLEGGNLLTNGDGLFVASLELLKANWRFDHDDASLQRLLSDHLGCQRLVFLEALLEEPTGHVDMFVTFPTSDCVLVGRLSPEADPVNAALLDRNAARLRRVRTARGPLRVQRIPMPPRRDESWPTYTNVVYLPGVVLVPQYPGLAPELDAEALRIFRRLLPGREVIGIDCTELIEFGGALHCVTLNLDIGEVEGHREMRVGSVPASPSVFAR